VAGGTSSHDNYAAVSFVVIDRYATV